MGIVTRKVGIYCDYPRCQRATAHITNDFIPYPDRPGWERWVGSRRMDYCPEHATRPKGKNMRRVWPAAAADPAEQGQPT